MSSVVNNGIVILSKYKTSLACHPNDRFEYVFACTKDQATNVFNSPKLTVANVLGLDNLEP